MYLSCFFLKEDILRGSELASLQAEALNHVLSFCKGGVLILCKNCRLYDLTFIDICKRRRNDDDRCELSGNVYIHSRTSTAPALIARLPYLTTTLSWIPMVPYMGLRLSNFCIYVTGAH